MSAPQRANQPLPGPFRGTPLSSGFSLLLLVVAATFVVCSPTRLPARDTSTEIKVKAAFVYNFLKFVHWPGEETNVPVQLCVTGESRVAAALKGLEGKRVQGRPLEVVSGDFPNRAGRCQAVFIGADRSEHQTTDILGKLGSTPVLTVSDRAGFIRLGGMIELFKARNKIRFKVNLGAARAGRLRISSELLKLAREVVK